MASFHVSMPEEMRDFIQRRAREGGFGTPTEYIRSLIRADRQKAEQELYGPLILKWLAEGELSPEERASLPPGLLERVTRNLRRMIQEGIDSGPGRELTHEDLEEMKREVLRRAGRISNEGE